MVPIRVSLTTRGGTLRGGERGLGEVELLRDGQALLGGELVGTAHHCKLVAREPMIGDQVDDVVGKHLCIVPDR